MCMLQQDHCVHGRIQTSLALPQEGPSHMDIKHLLTSDPSTGTGFLAALELLNKRKHSKNICRHLQTSAGICRQHCSAGRVNKGKYNVSLSFYIIIYHKFLCTFFLIVQYYFHVTVSHF